MTDAKVPTETERVMPDSRPAVLALPTDAAIANRDAVSSLTPASHSDFSRRSGNTAQPETDDTSDMDDERDDSPYCDCGAIPGEEEEAANRCDCCGKRIEPRSAPCREVHMSQYTDHDREQLEQWLDAYCNQDGTERVLTGKILDYIAATNERLRSPGGASEQHQQALDRACYVIMELMQAYERRIRSDCTTPEQLAANPWECAEYIKAERFLKAIWKDGRAQPFAALDEFLGYLRTAPEPEDLRAEVERLRVERYLCVLAMRCAMGAHHDGVDAMRERLEPVVARYGIATACAARAAISDADAACIEAQYSRSEIAGSSGEPVAKPNPCRNECSLISLDDDHWKCNHCDAVFAYTGAQKPVEKPRCWWPLCKETAGDALCDAVQSALTKGEKP